MTDDDLARVEKEIRETVGLRWGRGCFAERKKWGECPDLAGESCPYCWGITRLRHQRAEGLRMAAPMIAGGIEIGVGPVTSKILELADRLEKGE